MITLGIESSCDETSVAILDDGVVKANLISSQDFHTNYGGVVPELSSRAHLTIVNPLVKEALQKTGIKLEDIEIITATAGPGLIGALLVGLTYAKGLSYSLNKPFIAVNHIEGHIFSGFLMEAKPEFPMLTLVVSGGHTLLLLVKSFTEIYKLGSTLDDAAGEAFDKVSKMLGLGYPGGPKIQTAALKADDTKIGFPIADLKTPYDFSFSGLKTSVLRFVQMNFKDSSGIDPQELNEIAAGFQKAVVDALTINCKKALDNFEVKSVSVVGGVAANKKLREQIKKVADSYNLKLVIPDLKYCGDNAAMIAYRGKTLFDSGITHKLNYKPFPGLPDNAFISIK